MWFDFVNFQHFYFAKICGYYYVIEGTLFQRIQPTVTPYHMAFLYRSFVNFCEIAKLFAFFHSWLRSGQRWVKAERCPGQHWNHIHFFFMNSNYNCKEQYSINDNYFIIKKSILYVFIRNSILFVNKEAKYFLQS